MKKWLFDAHIYAPSGNNHLKLSHAQLPTPLQINESTFRIFYSSRDKEGKSRPFFLDFDMRSKKVVNVSQQPVIELGAPGTFDDCGIMPSSCVRVDKDIYFYYIGWNQRRNISYHLAIGLAISRDNGETFEKISSGPILDRNLHDPIFCAAPCVHRTENGFTMWYISGTGWPEYNGKPEPVYLVKRATSIDGIQWQTTEDVCIPYKFDGEALGRPWVTTDSGGFHMIYSSRGTEAYRETSGEHYRLGYATSKDGVNWVRKDSEFDLQKSGLSWDDNMQEYSSVFQYKGTTYMLYNGNTFGASGFGLARLAERL